MPVLTIGTTSGGTTNPVPGGYTYPSNQQVSVQAIPNSGYTFDYWSSDAFIDPHANPARLYVTENFYITAHFKSIGSLYSNVTVSVVGQGATDPVVGNHPSTYELGSTLSVTATPTPASGWQYKRMKRNGTVWTEANPGEFANLAETEGIEVVFEETGPPPMPTYPEPWTFTVTQAILDDVSSRYGAVSGSSNYIAYYDVNNDGTIDVKDIAYFSSNFGKEVTLPIPPKNLYWLALVGIASVIGIGYWIFHKR